ncbi:MAG: hypothetical protein KJN76_10525 [Eudoraea sp.]|nr:hypothetical protein [Eudoraea sp.]
MNEQQLITWLLKGDVALQYQVHRDLLGRDRSDLQHRIATEGWGKQFLSKRASNGHWGKGFYSPKWILTHYTLLDLRNLCLSPESKVVKDAIKLTLNTGKAEDGGIRLGPSTAQHSDVCVNGMFLNYASYFKTAEQRLHSVVDSILKELMPDGGFNCRTTRSGATHSSLHTTLSVLEGITEFLKTGHQYRKKELHNAKKSAEEFILTHQLYRSDRTGEIIRKEFLKIPYPCRWKYDILRALDYFQFTGRKWDKRMEEAIEVIRKKRSKDGTWKMQAAHPGQQHFIMEKAGQPSRWNTLRVMRVFKHFSINAFEREIN